MILETLQLPFLSRSQLMDRIRIENLDILTEAMGNPRGCLVVSAHLGNWELGLQALSVRLGRSVLTVAKPVKIKTVNRWLMFLRSQSGNRVVFKKGAMSAMMRAFRSRRTVAVLMDQGVRRSEAVEISFFNHRTMASPAPALLAIRCRIPVVPMVCTREQAGRYLVTIQPPLIYKRSGDLRRDISAYTQALMDTLEVPIRSHPEQWFWFHKRWKHTHPLLYPEYQVLRRRKKMKKRLNV
jgi:KDO2-lipid IV(A) lauroyltransferase